MSRKNASKGFNDSRRFQRDDENRVIINMTVKDDSNFLSVFSQSDTPVINTEVAEFIENSTNSVLPKEQLTLRIHSDCIDDTEKAIYREAIKEYYREKRIADSRELNRNNIIALLLTVAGVAVLICMAGGFFRKIHNKQSDMGGGYRYSGVGFAVGGG